jgi:hypothetical protein
MSELVFVLWGLCGAGAGWWFGLQPQKPHRPPRAGWLSLAVLYTLGLVVYVVVRIWRFLH